MFLDKLENAVGTIKGCEAAILMGFDGIAVDSFEVNKESDIETVGMELSVVLKEVRKAAELLEAGSAEEMTVRTEKMSTVMRIVNDEYFLAMMLAPDGNLGKAKYLLRILAPDFGKELS
jgi:predicted regulator of Ras-like GTPase activity (Roadblock/LC7/MglB family)